MEALIFLGVVALFLYWGFCDYPSGYPQHERKKMDKPHYIADCGTTLAEGDHAYDYYSMKPGVIGKAEPFSDGKWFMFIHDDGTETLLNGQRICSDAYAKRRGFPNAGEVRSKKGH